MGRATRDPKMVPFSPLDLPSVATTTLAVCATEGLTMRTTYLERLLLSAYREAIRQNDLMVADIVLSAIEACAPPEAAMTDAVIEAYCDLAVRAMVCQTAPPTGSERAT